MSFVHHYITSTYYSQESSLHGMEVKTTEIYRLLWQKIFPMNNEKENSEVLDYFSQQAESEFFV